MDPAENLIGGRMIALGHQQPIDFPALAGHPQAADFRREELTDREQQVVSQLREKLRVLEDALTIASEAVRRITEEALDEAVPEIVILREIWSGTTIQLGKFKTVVRSSVHKPRLARLNKNKVRILPLGDGNMPKD